jgi:hypothetical protein
MVKVEVEKPKPKFHIVTVGNRSRYFEQDEQGHWLLKKEWVEK